MLETINSLDRALFLFFNVTLANPITDTVMPVLSADWYLRILYGVAICLLLIKGDAKVRWLVIFSAVTLLFTDQVSAGFLKPLIARARPCQSMSDIHLLVGCGGGMSMPSSHAANAFGQAALFSLTLRRTRWYLWAFAALVAASRVFVGVHYPGDVIIGAGIGVMTAIALVFLFRQLSGRLILRTVKRPLDLPDLEPVEK